MNEAMAGAAKDSISMRYNDQVGKITLELSDCIDTTMCDAVAAGFGRLLGISTSEHLSYLSGERAAPLSVQLHLETLLAIAGHSFAQIVLPRILPSGLEGRSIHEIALSAISQWELATGQKLEASKGYFYPNSQWSVQAASAHMAKLLQKKNGDLLTLHELAKQVPTLVAKMPTQSMGYSESVALGKLQWLLKQEQVQKFRADFFLYLADTVWKFRDPIPRQDVEYLEGLPTEEVERAESDFETMKKVSLSNGDASMQPPVYSKLIFAFNSIEDMATKMALLPTGFALCAILNSNRADSYFVVVVKNGGNVTLLSDMPNYVDPLQEARMAQRNNRYNEDRHQNTYFPYNFLNLEWSDKGRVVTEKSDSTTLVDPKTNIRVLGNFNQLSVQQLLWFGCLVELCYERYFQMNVQEQPIGLLTVQTVQIGYSASDLNSTTLPADLNPFMAIRVPKSAELTKSLLLEHMPDIQRTNNTNQWMEDKYAEMVPSEALYMMPGVENTMHLLEFQGKGGVTISAQLPSSAVSPLPSSKIYTHAESVAASIYIGRYNQSMAIKALAKSDFEQNKDSIKKWVYRHIIKNVPSILDDLVSINHSRFYLSAGIDELNENNPRHTLAVRQIHFMKMERSPYIRTNEASEVIKGLKLVHGHFAQCYIQKFLYSDDDDLDSDPDHCFMLQISNVYDLVNLTGLKRSQLPIELQYYKVGKHLGNTLLDAHDPLDLIDNPWDALQFTFSLPVTKKAVNKRRKELGLPALRKPVPNYWEYDHDPDAKALYDYLRVDTETPIIITNNKPSFIHHFTSEIGKN